jgi:hypothetical protein
MTHAKCPLVVVDRPARSPSQVEAFLTQKPSRPYQEIGVLAYRAGTAEKYVDVVQYMREKAAQLASSVFERRELHQVEGS